MAIGTCVLFVGAWFGEGAGIGPGGGYRTRPGGRRSAWGVFSPCCRKYKLTTLSQNKKTDSTHSKY